jgi:cell division protease FtsH
MAEAVAGETGKPYVFVDPGAFINMFMGVGILKVKSLFRKLRRLALRYGGVIVFFDEADSLGNRGQMQPGPLGGPMATPGPFDHDAACHGLSYLSNESLNLVLRAGMPSTPEPPGTRRERFMMGMGGGGGGGMGTLQALLTELSGLKKPRGLLNRYARRALGMRPKPPPKYRILVMMATNMPDALDEAMLRPGRIDRVYKVGYPSKDGRKRTYEGYLAKVSHSLTDEEVEKLAVITPYATGATIKDLVNEALINAIRQGRDTITWADVIAAKHLKDLGPPEDVEYIERERHAIAVHEACHAVAAYRTRHHWEIDLATIEKGGTYLGMVMNVKPEDQFTMWRTHYQADIMVSLASLAGERMFFDGDSSSGVSGDLRSATAVAMSMEGYWGMGQTITSHGVVHKVGIGGGGRPGGKDADDSEMLKGSLGERIEANLKEQLDRVESLLQQHRVSVLALAHALETHKTLSGDDVKAVIAGTPGPLIDGRLYYEPAFVECLEAYHVTVMQAHKNHEPVTIPLPSLNGQAVPAAAAIAAGSRLPAPSPGPPPA